MAEAFVDDPHAMPAKWLLAELYRDMQIVKPAVVALVNADLPRRVAELEARHTREDAVAEDRIRIAATTGKLWGLLGVTVGIIATVLNLMRG